MGVGGLRWTAFKIVIVKGTIIIIIIIIIILLACVSLS